METLFRQSVEQAVKDALRAIGLGLKDEPSPQPPSEPTRQRSLEKLKEERWELQVAMEELQVELNKLAKELGELDKELKERG